MGRLLLTVPYLARFTARLDSLIAAKTGAPEEVLEAVQLGMGMTNSHEVALEEGANTVNIIRIGTSICGTRD